MRVSKLIRGVSLIAFIGMAFILCNTTVKAETVRDKIVREFSKQNMPSVFTAIGTGFVHNDSVDTPDKMFGTESPTVGSAEGLCGGKYDKYTYKGTAKYVRSLLLELGISPNIVKNEYFLSASQGEFLLLVQGQYQVVDYDASAKKYIVWCRGEWESGMEDVNCRTQFYNVSHRPGFYAIDKRYLYVDDVFTDQAVPASIGTGNIMKPYLLLYKKASTSADVYWWANQSVNQKINIIGEEGDFYKVSFQHTQFLRKRRICYVQKKYVNASLNDVNKPTAYYRAKLSGTSYIRTSASLSGKIIGTAYTGTEFEVISKGTEFDTVVFNGAPAYVLSKNMKDYVLLDAAKCNARLSGGIKIKKITKKSITFGWKKAIGADGYLVVYRNRLQRVKSHIKGNTISVPMSIINRNINMFTIWVYPTKLLPDGKSSIGESVLTRNCYIPRASSYKVKKKGKKIKLTYYRTKVSMQIEYATNKKFKSAKSVWVKGSKKLRRFTKQIKKKNRKWYFRSRGYIQYKIGKKSYRHYGNWSKVKRV